jgi:hypothetical protein
LAANFLDAHHEYVVSVGRPADTIAALALEHGAGLVVMGLADSEDSEPRTPGSIAYRVLRLAAVPVVVVPRSPVRQAGVTEQQPSRSVVARADGALHERI